MSDPDEWNQNAACRTTQNPDQFFSDHKGAQRHALAICADCPVITECLQYAVEAGLPGVWGGTTHLERLLEAAGTTYCAAEGHELTAETAFVRQKSASYRLACLVCNRAAQARYKQRTRGAAKGVLHGA